MRWMISSLGKGYWYGHKSEEHPRGIDDTPEEVAEEISEAGTEVFLKTDPHSPPPSVTPLPCNPASSEGLGEGGC